MEYVSHEDYCRDLWWGREKEENGSKYSEKKVFSDGDNEIYEVTINGKTRFEVPDKNTGTRAILDTLDEAKDEVEANKRIEKYKSEQKKEQESKAEAEKHKYDILGSWGETLSNKEKALAIKQIEKQFKSPTGKVRSAKDVIDEKIAEGWKVHKDEDGKESFRHPDGVQSLGGSMGNATITKYAVHRSKELEKQSKDNFDTMPEGEKKNKFQEDMSDLSDRQKKVVEAMISGKDYDDLTSQELSGMSAAQEARFYENLSKNLGMFEGNNSLSDVYKNKPLGEFIKEIEKRVKAQSQKPSATEALKEELGKKKGDEKIFNDDGEKYSALRKDAEEKFKDIKDKDEFNKKYNEFIKDNQDNYLTKEEKGYKDYLADKGISKEKNNEIIQSSRNTFSNNGVQYSIAKGIRGYNLVGGEGSGKEIKVPYGVRGTIHEMMMWAKDNIGMESWKLKEDGAEKSKSKYKSQSDIQKETSIQAEKERTSKLAGEEKKSGIYNSDAKKLGYGSIKMDNIKDPKEKKIFEQLKISNMITDGMADLKPLYSYSSEGQDAGVWTDSRMMILDKKVSDEIYNTNKQRAFNKIKKKNPSLSDDEIIGQIIDKGTGSFPNYKQVIPNENVIHKEEASFTGQYHKGEKNAPDIVEYSDGEISAHFMPDYIATIRNKFPDAKMHLSGEFAPAVFKVGNEIKAVVMPIQKSNDKKMSTMEKALSNLREELMFKAAGTKYIKKIPNPKGKGYIYFYTPEQVKAFQKDGTLPDQKKEGDEKKPESDKKQILKDSLKKIASIFSDALSGKDTVQPTGSGVEQAGEKISADQKAKKRLEENKKKSENKPQNKPEEKPKK